MENTNMVNRTLTRNLILSSIVWASVIRACSLNRGDSQKEITYILLSGFFIEFFRMSSTKKSIKLAIGHEDI